MRRTGRRHTYSGIEVWTEIIFRDDDETAVSQSVTTSTGRGSQRTKDRQTRRAAACGPTDRPPLCWPPAWQGRSVGRSSMRLEAGSTPASQSALGSTVTATRQGRDCTAATACTSMSASVSQSQRHAHSTHTRPAVTAVRWVVVVPE